MSEMDENGYRRMGSMDIWNTLGIQATKDKAALKQAYRTKLTAVNPEDDPEGFMELRQAYEEAVRLADEEENIAGDESAMGELKSAIDGLYRDFSRRISREAWEALLNRDEFVSLESSEEALDVLLRYLMSNFYLPQRIWKYLVEMFDIAGRKKELCETYPEDFIEYILNNAEYEDMINYDLFEGDEASYDAYIENYYKLEAAIRRREPDEQEKYIEKLEALDVSHPYYDICRIRREIQRMNMEAEKQESESGESRTTVQLFGERLLELQEQAEALRQDIPEDIFIINTCGDVAMIREQYEEAKRYYDMSLELAPDNYIVRGKQAELLYCMGEYEKSRDLYMELLKINHFDNNVRAGMIRANQGLIEMLREKIDADPSDNASRMEMAWSFYQSYRFDEAIAVLDTFEPDAEKLCEYHNVKGRTYLCLSDYENALACFQIWKSEIEKIPETDTDEEGLKKKKRYEYVNFLIGDCYLKTGRYDEARAYLDRAMEKEHEEIILSYEARCELEYETGNYDACIAACDSLLERDNRSYIGYNYSAKAYYNMDYLKEALIACEHAIGLYPYVSDPYGLEVQIYLKVNQPESARNVVQRYRAFGIESDKMDYSEACILEQENKHEEIVALLDKTIKRSDPEDTDLDDYYELYMMQGFHLEKLEKKDQAKKNYELVISKCPDHPLAYGRMGIILRDEGRYDDALKMYTKQLEIRPRAFYYIHRGILNRFLHNYKSAIADFEEALKFEPDNAFCYGRIGQIYELHREFERALEYYDKALAYSGGDDEDRKTYLCLKARTLQCMNRFAESREIYALYIEQYGLDTDVAYDYSELLQRMNLIDEAVGILQRCIDEVPYDSGMQQCIRQLCAIYGSEGYIDRAHETMMLAVSHNDKDARIYARMASIFFHHGLLDEARQMYEKAVGLDIGNKQNYYSDLIEVILSKRALFKPDIREYVKKALILPEDMQTPIDYINMAKLNRLEKKPREAIKIIDRGLKIKRCTGCFYSTCHEALYEKGKIYESMKQYEKARMCYREALKVCGHNTLYEESLKRIEGK